MPHVRHAVPIAQLLGLLAGSHHWTPARQYDVRDGPLPRPGAHPRHALLAGLHDAWPQLSGRRYAPSIAVVAAIVIFVGTWPTFAPMFALGLAGASFRANSYPAGFQVPEVLATAGMTVLLTGLALALANLFAGWCGRWSCR
jgi:heme/copper-type cytochrome/quinol oxidase subunit 1